MSVVIDASIALSWVLPGEKASPSLTLRDKLVDSPETGRLLVPPNYWYEVANTLWVAVRRERITRQRQQKCWIPCWNFNLLFGR